jgi:hypothetical protein
MAWIVADLYAAQTVCVGYYWLREMAHVPALLGFK